MIILGTIDYVCIFIFIMNSTQHSTKAKSLRTKYLARRSEIDETLFGIKPHRTTPKPEEALKLAEMVRKRQYNHPQLAVISEHDLQRMKNTAKKSNPEQNEQIKLDQLQTVKKQAQAKERRQSILKYDKQQRENLPQSEIEKEKKAKRHSLNSRAIQIGYDNIDEVKEMNKMVAYAKTATIRERQLEEKKQSWEMYKQQEKRKDRMMEIQRLKKIQQLDEIQSQKRNEAFKGKQVIIEQIKQREMQRLRAKEEQEKEAKILIAKMSQLQKQQQARFVQKRIQQFKLQNELNDANELNQKLKQKKKEEEKEEDERIMYYLKQKATKEAEIIVEQKKIKEKREKEIQKLRELQEQAVNRQSELDSLRAKRAEEANERMARMKDKQEAEKRAMKSKELQEGRQQQKKDKEKMITEQIRAEKAEFEQILMKQKERKEEEEMMRKERKVILLQNASEIEKQIREKAEQRESLQKNRELENRWFRDSYKDKKELIQHIKKNKINELKDLSIPEKYIVQLEGKKIK